MKETKIIKLIKSRLKELNIASKHVDDNQLKAISDEINFLKGRLKHYKNVAQKYYRKT